MTDTNILCTARTIVVLSGHTEAEVECGLVVHKGEHWSKQTVQRKKTPESKPEGSATVTFRWNDEAQV
jgi:hypothetical protein